MEKPGFKLSLTAPTAMSFLEVFPALWDVAKLVSSADQSGGDGGHEV